MATYIRLGFTSLTEQLLCNCWCARQLDKVKHEKTCQSEINEYIQKCELTVHIIQEKIRLSVVI